LAFCQSNLADKPLGAVILSSPPQFNSEVSLFWFRRDLRIADNTGLAMALSTGQKVVGVFIFDENILSKLQDKDDRRVSFIYDSLQ
jgi:deoxyribodipyrimidine photo-lyase